MLWLYKKYDIISYIINSLQSRNLETQFLAYKKLETNKKSAIDRIV